MEEVKELLYQSVIYVGFDRVHNFFGVVIRVFDKNGMGLSLETRSNTSPENRRQKGREIQDRYFGTEMIQAMNDNVPEDQKKHFNTFLEGFCFGDFHTHDGLNDQQKELITFTFITTWDAVKIS